MCAYTHGELCMYTCMKRNMGYYILIYILSLCIVIHSDMICSNMLLHSNTYVYILIYISHIAQTRSLSLMYCDELVLLFLAQVLCPIQL